MPHQNIQRHDPSQLPVPRPSAYPMPHHNSQCHAYQHTQYPITTANATPNGIPNAPSQQPTPRPSACPWASSEGKPGKAHELVCPGHASSLPFLRPSRPLSSSSLSSVSFPPLSLISFSFSSLPLSSYSSFSSPSIHSFLPPVSPFSLLPLGHPLSSPFFNFFLLLSFYPVFTFPSPFSFSPCSVLSFLLFLLTSPLPSFLLPLPSCYSFLPISFHLFLYLPFQPFNSLPPPSFPLSPFPHWYPLPLPYPSPSPQPPPFPKTSFPPPPPFALILPLSLIHLTLTLPLILTPSPYPYPYPPQPLLSWPSPLFPPLALYPSPPPS